MNAEDKRGRGRPAVLGGAVERLQVRIPREVKSTLAALSHVSGISEAALVRAFILNGVETWTENVRAAQPVAETPRPRTHPGS